MLEEHVTIRGNCDEWDVALMRKMRTAYRILVGKPQRKKQFGDLGGMIISKWISDEENMKVGTELKWLNQIQLRPYGNLIINFQAS
jgi:hypothetical protein